MENLKISYQISPEEYLEGYDIFYRKKKRKFTFIKAGLFAIALLLFIQQVYIDPYYTIGWICIAICAGAIAAIFGTPKIERRNYEQAIKALTADTYELNVTKESLTVSTVLPDDSEYLEEDEKGSLKPHPEIPPTVMDLTDKSFKAYESEGVICAMDRDLSMTVPKSKLSKYDLEALRELLKPEEIILKK